MTDKSRGEFEAWFKPKKLAMQKRGIQSIRIIKLHQRQWEAWQESRAAIELDIPSSGDAEYWIDNVFQRVRFERDVEKAAIAAGLKVKGG